VFTTPPGSVISTEAAHAFVGHAVESPRFRLCFCLFSSTHSRSRHFDRSCSRFCEQRSGEIRFSTHTPPSHIRAAAVASSRRHPDTEPAQKYISKKRKILGSEKVSIKTPQFTTNPPQLNHDLPSRNTTKTQKPPAKTPLHHTKKIISQSTKN